MVRRSVGGKAESVAVVTDRKAAALAFLADIGWKDAKRTLIAGDASNRRYDRICNADGSIAILMDAPPERGENVRPFVRVAQYLNANGLSAPEILAEDTEQGFLLIEDLGDALFARLMEKASPEQTRELYGAAVDVLIYLRKAPPLSLEVCDANWLIEMTDIVFEWYERTGNTATRAAFEEIFRPMATQLDAVQKGVILRDYHAENLIWLPDRDGVAKVGLLDFQDALLGHPAYDLVSILQDARRDVPQEIENAMIAYYLEATHMQPEGFRSAYALLGTQRNLRILGIFARLCLRDGKAHYVDFIPRVWRYLNRNLEVPALAPLREFVLSELPEPTPSFLEKLKSQCGTIHTPS